MDVMVTKKAKELAGSVTTLDDLNGMMRSLMKTAIETTLHSDVSVPLGGAERQMVPRPSGKTVNETASEEPPAAFVVPPSMLRNRRNGSSPKAIQGELPIAIPRGREGTLESQLLSSVVGC